MWTNLSLISLTFTCLWNFLVSYYSLFVMSDVNSDGTSFLVVLPLPILYFYVFPILNVSSSSLSSDLRQYEGCFALVSVYPRFAFIKNAPYVYCLGWNGQKLQRDRAISSVKKCIISLVKSHYLWLNPFIVEWCCEEGMKWIQWSSSVSLVFSWPARCFVLYLIINHIWELNCKLHRAPLVTSWIWRSRRRNEQKLWT